VTVDYLENHYLTLRFWLRRYVLPTGLILIALLLLARFISGPTKESATELNNISAILGFFSLYFVLVRGGHLYMIRSMHFQLKTEFAAVYPLSLQELPRQIKIRQLGAALARIKANLYRRTK